MTKRKKRKSYKLWILTSILLLIPLSAAVISYLPQYYVFTAMGKIVSLQEIGVNSSVHFVYVQEGVTRNFYEKFMIKRTIPDAQFYPADASAVDDLAGMLDEGAEMRNETIVHALDSATEMMETEIADDERDQRLDQLIEETSNLYGDSIGLMLGIGLVEEREKADFSRNGKYTIAGTGTLEEDHTVGSVGSIRNKIRTAEAAGADIFFVPKDEDDYPYEGPSNEAEAAQVAQELYAKLRVVPVSSLEEAIAYLKQLN